MPGLDGLQATRTIANDPALAAVRILILTTFDLDEYVFEALRSGASGFLVKDTEPQDLLTAVRVVARTRDPHARGSGSLQPRDRRRARCQPLHRRDPRQPRNAQARRPRPRPTRRLRLRIRTRPPRLENLNQQPLPEPDRLRRGPRSARWQRRHDGPRAAGASGQRAAAAINHARATRRATRAQPLASVLRLRAVGRSSGLVGTRAIAG